MAQINFDPLKYLGTLPEFNGDNRELQNFIKLIDRVHHILQTYDELSQGLFSDLIKNKLKGKAREIIDINFQATSWTDIKLVLQNNFGDRLSCDELFDSLRATTFKTTSLEFFEEIKNKLRRLNSKTLLILGQGQDQGTLNSVAQNNSRTALNVFKSKIPEPMKTILTCRNPGTLEEAMNILFEAGYAHLRVETKQNFNYNRNEQKQQNHKQQNFKPHFQAQPRNIVPTFQNHGRNFSNQNQGRNFQKQYPQRQFPQQFSNQQPQTQNTRNPPQNIRYPIQQYQHFQNPQQQQIPPPEPMDINNHEVDEENFIRYPTQQQYQHFRNPTQQEYQHFQNEQRQHIPPPDANYRIVNGENFHLPASGTFHI